MSSQNETKDLIINKLTKEQYKTVQDANTNNEIYHITDDAHYTEAEIQALLNKKQNTLTSANAGDGISIQNGVISNTRVSAEWGNIQGDITTQTDLQNSLNTKANNNEVVHLSNTETISGAKTFTGAVNFTGSGDSNAIKLSLNTRINVHGTNHTVLGFSSDNYLIGHGNYRTLIRGKGERPYWTSTGVDFNTAKTIALTSDIPDVSNFITMADVEAKNYLTSVPDEYITQTELNDKGYASLVDIQRKADASTVSEQLELKADKSTTYTKSEVDNKIADAVTGGQIDLSGYAKDGEVVHLSNTETITGSKTFTQPLKIQNGAGTGSLLIGGDVNAGTVTNGARKLARIAVPTQANKDLTSILLGFDSNGDDALNITNRGSDNISFGGSKKITNATSPMSISFCVAKERNATEASKKTYALEMDANEARFNSKPNYNGVNLATTVDVTNALNGYAKLTDIPDISNLATKEELNDKQDILTAGENITIENGIISSKTVDLSDYYDKGEVDNLLDDKLENQSRFNNALSIGKGNTDGGLATIIGFRNTAEAPNTILIGSDNSTYGTNSVCIGEWCDAGDNNSICIGNGACTALENSIQLGEGFNTTPNSLQVWEHQLLNIETGKIPDERLSNNIAKITDIPDTSNLATKTELTEGLATKQPTGNYALKSDIPDVSNLATKSELTSKQNTLVDSSTIDVDGSSLKVIGVQSKSGDILYDWVGTEDEYNAGISNGSIDLNWLCYITDDESELINNIPVATTTKTGLVRPDGSTITINNGVISSKQYSLPVATNTTLGGVKVDNSTVKINNQVISVNGVNTVDNTLLKFKKLTQSQYDALSIKDENTLYIITG